MTVWEWIRLIAGAALLLFGVFSEFTAIVGNYRFNYVLCRMQAAGIGDTFGLFFLFAGITVLCGISLLTLKLAVIIALLWTSGPVISHLIVQMELRRGSGAGKEN